MAEIEKIAVYDARIIQDPPKYAVQKGALSVSTSQFQANAANANQLSFQVLVPSLNVFTDRKIELNASAYCYAEAVPAQQVSRYEATTDVPAGRYIDPPRSEANQYIAQDTPIVATFPPDGSSFIGEGNTACVLPANSWSGLGEFTSTNSTNITPTPVTTAPESIKAFPISITLTSQAGGPLESPPLFSTDLLKFNNIFAPFTGKSISGQFTVSYSFLAQISYLASAQSEQTTPNQFRFEIWSVTGTSAIATSDTYQTSSQSISQTGDVGVVNINFTGSGNALFSLTNNSTIQDVGELQIKIKWTIPVYNNGQTGDASMLIFSDTGTSWVVSGIALVSDTVVVDTPYRNWYQSIGLPSDLSLGMFPVQSLATSMTATINDCSVSVSGDVLHEQLLLSQTRDSLMQRTCPSKYDVYSWTADDVRSGNGAIRSYDEAKDSDIPNGSYPIQFVHPQTGLPFQQFDAYRYTNSAGQVVTVPVLNFRPVFIPYNSNLVGELIPSPSLTDPAQTTWVIQPTDCTKPVPVMFRFTTTEPLCLSPFLWQDSKQMTEVGLYGITNMTVNMTLSAPGAVVGYDTGSSVQQSRPRGRLYMDKLNNANGSYGYMTRQSGINALFGAMRLQPPANNAGNQTGPWVTPPRLLCTFLTPPPEITLPLVSSVPYVEFPRYTSTGSVTFTTGGTAQVQSNTVTLSSIPDLLVVFVKPAFRGQTQGDTYIPITNIGVTFDNYANLCSNYSQEDLYACSVAGGLDMDFNQFRGFARNRFPTAVPKSSSIEGSKFDTYTASSANVQLTGSPIVLRMGQDIPLSSGLAPGTLGNYSVQVSVTLDNSNGFFSYLGQIPNSNNVTVTIMGVNSGFFESVRGSSAIRKTILNTTDVEAASTSSSVTSSQLVRLVGGASGMHTSSRLTTSLGMPQFKPAMSEEPRRKMARMSGSMIP